MGQMDRRIRTPEGVQRRARELRQELTPAEKRLWEELRDRKLDGFKFRRQAPVGPFIADFYCAEYRLAVELDGGIHETQREQDALRTQQFENLGYRVIRFRNEEVMEDLPRVLTAIAGACRHS